jgi:hypothetical protein
MARRLPSGYLRLIEGASHPRNRFSILFNLFFLLFEIVGRIFLLTR